MYVYLTEVNKKAEPRTVGLKVINSSHDSKGLSLDTNFKGETWLTIAEEKNNNEFQIEAFPPRNFFQAQDTVSFVATSMGKVEKSEDEFLIIDVRLTAEYFEKVEVPNSENIQNLIQISVSNENTVPASDEFDPVMPHGMFRGR